MKEEIVVFMDCVCQFSGKVCECLPVIDTKRCNGANSGGDCKKPVYPYEEMSFSLEGTDSQIHGKE